MPSTALLALVLTASLAGIPGESIENPPPPTLRPGSTGPSVVELQQRLEEAGFFPGRKDGVYGRRTRAAVYAMQKLFGEERTGIFRSSDWSLLDLEIRGPGLGPEPDRIEVDLGRQVLYLIEAEQVTGVFPISSGNGELFRNYRGRLVNANTPEGRFEFGRRYTGWRTSYLGSLYAPSFFYGGYAVHGSGSVPPFPASHGCVRVEIEDMDFLNTRIEVGMAIYLYGDDLTRSDLIPDQAVALPGRFQPSS